MASVTFNVATAGNDPWELLFLAGGDPTKTTYDPITFLLTNNTVTQLQLDNAVVALNAGTVSVQKQQEIAHQAESTITPTDLSLAILGDAASILKLQTLLATTAPTITLPAVGTPIQNALAAQALAVPSPTLYTTTPLITLSATGFTNTAGAITATTAGTYNIIASATFLAASKYALQSMRILKNGLPTSIIASLEAGKRTFKGSFSMQGSLTLTTTDIITLQYLGDAGGIYNSTISIRSI